MIGSDGPGVGGGRSSRAPGEEEGGGAGRTSAGLGAYRSLWPLGKASGVPTGREAGRVLLLLLGQNGTGRGLCPQEIAAVLRSRPPGAGLRAVGARKGDEGKQQGPASLSVPSPCFPSPDTLVRTRHTRTRTRSLPPIVFYTRLLCSVGTNTTKTLPSDAALLSTRRRTSVPPATARAFPSVKR